VGLQVLDGEDLNRIWGHHAVEGLGPVVPTRNQLLEDGSLGRQINFSKTRVTEENA
jgi:hypothetical protein